MTDQIDYRRMMYIGRSTFTEIQASIDDYIYNYIYIHYLLEEENIPHWFETFNQNDPDVGIDWGKAEEMLDEIISNTTIDIEGIDIYDHFHEDLMDGHRNAHGHLLRYILYSGRKQFGNNYRVPDDAMSYISDACIIYTYRWLIDNKRELMKRLVNYRKEDFEREEEDRVADI
jgi:hypothetical protein